jgi:hypothetical protein
MAETGELIGAEDYYLSNCKDIATAQVFLEMVQRYKSEVRSPFGCICICSELA